MRGASRRSDMRTPYVAFSFEVCLHSLPLSRLFLPTYPVMLMYTFQTCVTQSFSNHD